MTNFWKRLFLILSLLAQLGLAVSPFIPWVQTNIWAAQTSVTAFASTLATYIGAEFACLGILVALFLLDIQQQGNESSRRLKELLQEYTPLQVRRLKESEFYKEFLGHCISAKHYVKICYFAPVPPDQGAPDARKKYYRRLLSVMKSNPDAMFRRILRDTKANRVWAEEMIRHLAKATNFSIALLKDIDAEKEMPLALSVQIIDERYAWLVAVSEHSDSPLYRDVAVENEILVEVLDKYFDRLWSLSTVVFKPGYTLEQTQQLLSEEA